MNFCKYKFPNHSIWDVHKSLITDRDGNPTDCSIVEIGKLIDGFAVDIMWYYDIPTEFNSYEVFPKPVGIHTFIGCDDMYVERYCHFNPESEYCNQLR